MEAHPVIGDRLCGDLRSLQRVRSIVRHHHERLDGSGYPDGLRGDDIPLLAQIIGIVDVYDALTTTRPYHAAQPPEAAFAELREEVRRGWRRADLVEAFIEIRQRRGQSRPSSFISCRSVSLSPSRSGRTDHPSSRFARLLSPMYVTPATMRRPSAV